jgi:hypothetical protein
VLMKVVGKMGWLCLWGWWSWEGLAKEAIRECEGLRVNCVAV